MPRRPRVVIAGGLYHVYNRCARGEPVFAGPQEAIEFVELARAVKERDGLTVFAWTVLSSHFHMALRAPQPAAHTGRGCCTAGPRS